MKKRRKRVACDQYDRYCRQIDKEDDLIDKRIGWLLTSQTILFAALSLSGDSVAGVLLQVVPIAGLGSSLLIGFSIWAALFSIVEYRGNLLKGCPSESDPDKLYP